MSARVQYILEKIRLSITRLKHTCFLNGKRHAASAWKDKTLDYEIETFAWLHQLAGSSIAWKDKTLDYEIETDMDKEGLTHWQDLKR